MFFGPKVLRPRENFVGLIMIKLTVDANILHSLLRPSESPHEDANRLWSLHKNGAVTITVTTRIDVDVPRDPLKSAMAALDLLRIPTIGRSDYSSYDGDHYASEEELNLNNVLTKMLFPEKQNLTQNDIADIDHLIGHRSSGNDHFITNDGRIVQRSNELKSDVGISVMSLDKFIRMYSSST